MADKKTVGSVTYTQTDKDYFAKRGLRRYARVWSLWALGVGAVISGHYSGWNFGICADGFGGMFIAAVHHRDHVLGPDLQHRRDVAGAAAHRRAPTRSRAARSGPWGGIITGLAESIEYILTPAVIVFFIGSYMTGDLRDAGRQRSRCGGSAATLVFLLPQPARRGAVVQGLGGRHAGRARGAGGLLGQRDSALRLRRAGRSTSARVRTASRSNCPTAAARSCRSAVGGALAALPFAVWLFLAIEQLPLAAEESVRSEDATCRRA